MATYNKFQPFVLAVAEGKHNLSTGQLRVALCAAANAPTAGNATLSQLTTISTANLDTTAVATASSSQTSGTYSLVTTDLTMTATGAVPTFRYVVIYNDTATNDDLICWFDYGSDVTLASGETFTIDFGANLFTLA